ncbi:SPW repeat domain-containing protein [Polyangium mundeleinium]|uniref:SPW repeat protein n=1 Tax=Polyangium mundeleinium TaxID=2995306 RepID=A0ABT5EGN1_9BACT|nr:SPW repeat protein [Polyangium mundeleinium]MDC0740989.1 SPW repeat protein [Polyangium mundeleinium]
MTWPRWINVALGIWLLIAPALLGYVDAYAVNNDRLLGILIAASAIVALWAPKARFVNVVLGAWLIIAPFVLGYFGRNAVANDIVVGIAVAVFAFIPSRSITSTHTTAGPGDLS